MALNIINNIQHATATVVEAGYDANAKVVAESGYKFTAKPTCKYKSNDYGYFVTYKLNLNADQTEATYKLIEPDFTASFTFEGTTAPTAPTDITVTNNIADTTETHTYDGETATITVTSANKPRYRFINPRVTYTDKAGTTHTVNMTVEVKQTNSIATAVITNVDDTKPVTIEGEFVYVVLTEKVLNNCTSANEIPEFYRQRATIDITLNANPNTVFNKAPTLQHDGDTTDIVTTQFTVSADKTTATINYTLPYDVQRVVITATAEPAAVVGQQYGSINVYRVTLDNLADFANVRFFKEQLGTDAPTYELIDMGVYVNRIKRIFCDVHTASTDVIRCGNYNTNISCLQPQTDVLTLNFGDVGIPSHNSDNTDFQSEIKLFMPFVGFVDIPNDYAGQKINLQCMINVVTGNGVAMLSYNGVVFDVMNFTPSTDVIYRTSTETTIIGGQEWNEQKFYGLEPYLWIKWYRSANREDRNTTRQTAKIGTFRGFTAFENVGVITTPSMLAQEQTAIYNALQNGVYIE